MAVGRIPSGAAIKEREVEACQNVEGLGLGCGDTTEKEAMANGCQSHRSKKSGPSPEQPGSIPRYRGGPEAYPESHPVIPGRLPRLLNAHTRTTDRQNDILLTIQPHRKAAAIFRRLLHKDGIPTMTPIRPSACSKSSKGRPDGGSEFHAIATAAPAIPPLFP